jgi:alkanesulfonate monooxygenase SsuD/methylene tetrahydromethanopterin reductase-like flavin-dependent oxidoreductase (luciferase family)
MVPVARSDGAGHVLPTWEDIRAFAEHAETVGLDSLWVSDHFFGSFPGAPLEGVHEAWTITSALAAATSRVEIGQLVSCASYRHPGLLAKMAVTADDISGGRLVLGLGAGWHDTEYEAFGFPKDHRVSRLDEYLRIVVPLLRGETVNFEGRYNRAVDAVLLPAPQRRLPVLVAGNGPQLLRLVARHADAWNTAWFGRPDERLRTRLAALEEALEAEGRDAATLRRTVGLAVIDPAHGEEEENAFSGSVGELAEMLRRFEELGFADAIVVLEPMTAGSLDRLAEAIALSRGS